jgi:hypothetical protein
VLSHYSFLFILCGLLYLIFSYGEITRKVRDLVGTRWYNNKVLYYYFFLIWVNPTHPFNRNVPNFCRGPIFF